jgi:hypothetical protein
VIRAETTRRTEWIVARHIGGDEELEPVQNKVLTPRGDEAAEVAQALRELHCLIGQTGVLRSAA